MAKRAPRTCDRCGKPYWRSNTFRLWTIRNPGHRDGWGKIEEKLCNNCCNEGMARRTAVMYGVRIVPINRQKVS